MTTITTLPARGQVFDYTTTARKLTREYLAGFQAGITWMESGAPLTEVNAVADFYEQTRPGQSHEEATHYEDADAFLSLLACMHLQGHGHRFVIEVGSEVRTEFIRNYGPQFLTWDLPGRVFTMTALDSFDDGLAAAVWQASRG